MVKVRITKKEKSGITLHVKNAEPVKISWDEFNENYEIRDHIWAVMKPEMEEKFNKMSEYADKAVTAAILIGVTVRADVKFAQYAILGESVEKISEIMGCTTLEAMNIVKTKLDSMRCPEFPELNPYAKKKTYNRHTEKKKPVQNDVPASMNTLGDNPVLQKLKESMSS